MQDVSYSRAQGQHKDHRSFKAHLNTILKVLVGLLHSITLLEGINLMCYFYSVFEGNLYFNLRKWHHLVGENGSLFFFSTFFSKFGWFLLFSHSPPSPSPPFWFSLFYRVVF